MTYVFKLDVPDVIFRFYLMGDRALLFEDGHEAIWFGAAQAGYNNRNFGML